MHAPTTSYLPLAAGRVVLGYLAAAVAWIVLSDQLTAALASSADARTALDTVKGLGFVATTGALLAVLLRRYERERARHVAELAERERGFRLLADNARDVIFRYRIAPARGVEYVSPSVEAILGHRPDAFYADPDFLERLIHPDDPSIFPIDPGAVPAADLVVRRSRRPKAAGSRSRSISPARPTTRRTSSPSKAWPAT